MNLGFPIKLRHIHMTVLPKLHPFRFQQWPMLSPSGSCAPNRVHHPMTRISFRSRGIAQGSSHHPRMTRPPRQGGNQAVGSYPSPRNLFHDIQHIVAKHPCLFRRHLVHIVLHLQPPNPLRQPTCSSCLPKNRLNSISKFGVSTSFPIASPISCIVQKRPPSSSSPEGCIAPS